MTAVMQRAVASQPRFDRRSKTYQLKLWVFSQGELPYHVMIDKARRLGISSPRFAVFEVSQTRQVLRDLGVSLPEPSQRATS